MSKFKNASIYPIIASICLIVHTIYLIWNHFSGLYSFTLHDAMWVVHGGLAGLLLLKKKNYGLLVAAGTGALIQIHYLILAFGIYYLLEVAVYISLFILFSINIIPSMSKYSKITKVLCFVPVGVQAIQYIRIWSYLPRIGFLSEVWMSMLFQIVLCVGFLFIGLWLRETVPEQRVNETTIDNRYATFNASPVQSPSPVGSADKLEIYKELLDAGVISQEEFETKKKQILDL